MKTEYKNNIKHPTYKTRENTLLPVVGYSLNKDNKKTQVGNENIHSANKAKKAKELFFNESPPL